MPQVQLRRQEQIQERVVNRTVSRSDLSDLADSSGLKHLVAAFSRDLDDAYLQLARLRDQFDISTASGDDLDERAKEIQPGTLRRLGSRRAVGTLVFSRAGTVGTVIIPAGTTAKTTDGIVVQTTIQSQISDGASSSISVPAIAAVAGEDGNITVSTAIVFGSKPAGVDTVTNDITFTQGRDKESDPSFRDRIRGFVAALAKSTEDALEFVALGITEAATGKEVVFSHSEEDVVDPPLLRLFIDDGAGTIETTALVTGENVTRGLAGPPADSAVGGEEFLTLDEKPVRTETPFVINSSTRGDLLLGTTFFINPAKGLLFFTPPLATAEVITATYVHFTGLIAEVQRVIDGDPADRVNFPGFRAGGAIVRVLAPTVVLVSVESVLTILDGFNRDEVITNVKSAVSGYINNLGISGDVIDKRLIEVMMAVPGVFDLVLVSPTSNIPILDSEIARIVASGLDIT